MDDGAQLDQQVFLQSGHLGPVLDVGTVAQLGGGIGLAEALIAALGVNGAVIGVLQIVGRGRFVLEVGSGSQHAAVGCGGSDGTGIHQCDGRDLAVAGLGAFAVGEVTGGVTDGQCIVGRGITGTEAGAAECRLHDCTGLHQGGGGAVFGDSQIDGCRGSVNAHIKVAVADGLILQNGGGLHDVLVHTARAAHDDALIAGDLAVHDVAAQIHGDLAAQLLVAGLFHLLEDALGIGLQLMDGVGDGGMEGQRDHTLNLAQVDMDNAVVISAVFGLQLLKVFGTADIFVIGLDLFVGDPDGGQAGGLGGHNVHADTEVTGQLLHTGADELQNLVLHVAVGEGCGNQSDGHVLRADALLGLAVQIDHNHFGSGHVVGIFQQLLDQLAAAFTNTQTAVSAVTGVGVGTQNHLAAAGQTLTGVLVDNGLIGGNIDAAVFLSGRQAEGMVILVDGAADGAQGVVAVGHGIRNREFLQTGGLGSLDDTHEGDVVGDQSIKLDLHFLGIFALVVSTQNGVGDGFFTSFVGSGCVLCLIGINDLSVYQISALFDDFYHRMFLLVYIISKNDVCFYVTRSRKRAMAKRSAQPPGLMFFSMHSRSSCFIAEMEKLLNRSFARLCSQYRPSSPARCSTLVSRTWAIRLKSARYLPFGRESWGIASSRTLAKPDSASPRTPFAP